jgi:hypothetical protein
LELPHTLAKLNKCTRNQLMTKFIWAPFVMQKMIYVPIWCVKFSCYLGHPNSCFSKIKGFHDQFETFYE